MSNLYKPSRLTSKKSRVAHVVKSVGASILLATIIVSAVYFQWWRCGEMFPHAQVACFFGSN